MLIREAIIDDILQMQIVRNAFKENALSNPALVSYQDYVSYLTARGKGWVCEINDTIVGFAIADLQDNNIWALFILPAFEGKGIGMRLHKMVLDWYINQGKETVWLSTAPGTRAELFYKAAGWVHTGMYGKHELKFEMNKQQWYNSVLAKAL